MEATMKISERQLRRIIKEALEEAENTCWDGYRPGAQSGKKTKIGKTGKRVSNCEKIKEDEETDEEPLVTENIRVQHRELIADKYEKVDSSIRYPYGRHRGDVRGSTDYKRKDGSLVPAEDLAVFQALESEQRKDPMAALGGIYTHSVSDDGMILNAKYYKHTSD